MILPSIDLANGNAVQLVGGRELAIDAGDPRPIAERFALAGEVAVVDLDAALGRGSNAETIRDLCRLARCRVGGGIRNVEDARRWLALGASGVVIGTAAEPELLRQLPRDKVTVALDAIDGEVVVDGWRTKTGRGVLERMRELSGLVSGFLVTFVEREGRMQGTRLDQVAALVEAAGEARVTIAGGVTTAAEIAELDRLGADAQVGMALYSGALDLGDAIVAPLACAADASDKEPDELWPTIVSDENGVALGLAWSDAGSLREAVRTRRGVYRSRRRGLWRKGESSGDVQELLAVDLDCDRDALRFTVRQAGRGFCHTGERTCFGEDRGVARLARRLARADVNASAGSYTRRLLDDPELLRAKLLEEADELADARTRDEVVWETADVVYFAQVAMTRAGVTWDEVGRELDRREGQPRRSAETLSTEAAGEST